MMEALVQLRDHQRQIDTDGTFVGVSRQALDEVLNGLFISLKNGWNHDVSQAPKDRPILALCQTGRCGGGRCEGRYQCLYHAHAEGLGVVSSGPHVIEWGGSWEDSSEDGGGNLPDWWFRTDSEFEAVANPLAWMEIPEIASV